MATAQAPARNGNNAPPARGPKNEVKTTPLAMKDALAKAQDRLVAVLPKHLTPERMAALVSTMMFRNPKLQECDQNSILSAVMLASSLGLDLAPSLQEAFLIPRWNGQARILECQFQPGYQGLRKLAMNSGLLRLIETDVIREGDHFVYRRTPDLVFEHEPVLGSRTPIIGAWSMARLATGELSVEVMSRDQIEELAHHRSEGYKRAQDKNETERGPWVTDYAEMCRKTVLKRHCKSLPRSIELAQAISADDREYESGVQPSRIMGTTATERLANRLAPPAMSQLPEPEYESQEPDVDPADVSQEAPEDITQEAVESPARARQAESKVAKPTREPGE